MPEWTYQVQSSSLLSMHSISSEGHYFKLRFQFLSRCSHGNGEPTVHTNFSKTAILICAELDIFRPNFLRTYQIWYTCLSVAEKYLKWSPKWWQLMAYLYLPPQEINVQVTFIERSPRAYTRTYGVRRDHREREHVQARERSRAWTSRTFAGRSWTSPERFLHFSKRTFTRRSRTFTEPNFLLTYLLTNGIGPTDLFLYYTVPLGLNLPEISLHSNIFACVVFYLLFSPYMRCYGNGHQMQSILFPSPWSRNCTSKTVVTIIRHC